MTDIYEPINFPALMGEDFEKISSTKKFSNGQTIYREGEAPHGLYFIKEGMVGLIHISSGGIESLLRVFGPCTFFGHRSFLANEPYHATAVALKDTTVWFIPAKEAQDIIETRPQLSHHFIKLMAKDLRNAENRLRDMSSKKVSGRIIEALLFLKHRHPNYQWTRREIGEFCGAKTETVSRVLGQLEKKGLIEKDGRDIHIVNEKGLLQEAKFEGPFAP